PRLAGDLRGIRGRTRAERARDRRDGPRELPRDARRRARSEVPAGRRLVVRAREALPRPLHSALLDGDVPPRDPVRRSATARRVAGADTARAQRLGRIDGASRLRARGQARSTIALRPSANYFPRESATNRECHRTWNPTPWSHGAARKRALLTTLAAYAALACMIFVQLTPFTAFRERIWSDEEFEELEEFLASAPAAGVLIPGGGLRKVRWLAQQRGKR